MCLHWWFLSICLLGRAPCLVGRWLCARLCVRRTIHATCSIYVSVHCIVVTCMCARTHNYSTRHLLLFILFFFFVFVCNAEHQFRPIRDMQRQLGRRQQNPHQSNFHRCAVHTAGSVRFIHFVLFRSSFFLCPVHTL